MKYVICNPYCFNYHFLRKIIYYPQKTSSNVFWCHIMSLIMHVTCISHLLFTYLIFALEFHQSIEIRHHLTILRFFGTFWGQTLETFDHLRSDSVEESNNRNIKIFFCKRHIMNIKTASDQNAVLQLSG